ncbi:MAG: hypothetical protein WC408_01865, partial [Candidatus Micrarchaeia archaeon]
AYIAFSALLEFWTGELDKKWVIINLMVVLGALAANITQLIYVANSPLAIGNGVLLLAAAFAFGAMLFAASHYKVMKEIASRLELNDANSKLVFLGIVFVAAAGVMAFTPLGSKVTSYLNYGLSFAKPDSAIMMTVAEESSASDAMDASSYGVFSYLLSPRNLLMLTALLAYLFMLITLWKKRHKKAALASLAILLFVFVFNTQFDELALAAATPLGLGGMASFVAANDIFYYMGLAIISTMVTYIFSDKKNQLPLLFILIFFPISFIGMHKTKYMVHLATSLPIAVGFLLFLLWELFEFFAHGGANEISAGFKKFGHIAVLAIAAILVLAQFANAVGSPMKVGCDETAWGKSLNSFTANIPTSISPVSSKINNLCYQRMGEDWRDAMTWMSINLEDDDRVLSWWDYGHWTTFLAKKKTVTDPGNAYPEYNQQVARALVNGPASELIDVMKYHNATYLMIDSELISKWGALNFLGSTYAGLYREPNPANNINVTPAADWTKGPGASTWELEHSFEFIYPTYTAEEGGQPVRMSCPGLIERAAYYSQLSGQLYCASAGANNTINLFLLRNAAGDQIQLKNPKVLQIGSGTPVAYSSIGTSGGTDVYINTNAAALNLNPDLETLSNGTKKSSLFNAPYVQLFFYEKLDGFELVHKSTNGGVKIFRRVA